MFRMMRAVPRMATLRQATIKSQTVRSVNQKVTTVTAHPLTGARNYYNKVQPEPEKEIDKNYWEYFNRTDISSLEVRRGMADLLGLDMSPHPRVVAAALGACRRLDDFSLAARILEVVKLKCGDETGDCWGGMLEELQPTFIELGIPTAAQLA